MPTAIKNPELLLFENNLISVAYLKLYIQASFASLPLSEDGRYTTAITYEKVLGHKNLKEKKKSSEAFV